MEQLGRLAREASIEVAKTSSSLRSDALKLIADQLVQSAEQILDANSVDIDRAIEDNLGSTALDRLLLSKERVESMATGLITVADLGDPVGEVVDGWVRPNGLRVERIRVPLGVIGVIYENRPNVTSDAAGLCLKAGNAVLLRGSGSSINSNKAIVEVMRSSLTKLGLPANAVTLVEDTSHAIAIEFMQLRGFIDCLIPRGGRSLIESLLENATVPYVLDGDGNCHIYVEKTADLEMALSIVVNAKTSRPGVCNAAETLLVDQEISEVFLRMVATALEGVELVGDVRTQKILPDVGLADSRDYGTEFLGLKLAVAVVDDISQAIDHISKYGTGHSEAIVTRDLASADRFVLEVDAAAVLVNASTRFIDGGELGLGAEVGISTQKLHARGPMGLRELTCTKWIVRGDGHIRQ